MKAVPRWAIVPAASGPVLAAGGWTYAAQGIPGFDSAKNTISDLTRPGAPHHVFISCVLVGLGLTYVVVAGVLRPAAWPGRVVLAFGGAVTAGVAAFPDPARGFAPAGQQHSQLAGAALVAMAVWPVLAVRRSAPAWVLTPLATASVSVVVLAGILAFQHRLGQPERYEGGIERGVILAETVWVLVTVVALTRAARPLPSRP